MQSRWREAVEVNKNLIENFPQDGDAYNRLGKAHMELGEFALSEEAYKKAVELDPFNNIAKKNLSRLPHIAKATAEKQGEAKKADPNYFIEETGKSRMFNLYRPAPPVVLARAIAGDAVNLRVEGSSLVVEDSRGEYLGMVEPRYGHRLVQLINGGNQYGGAVVSSSGESVQIIIREVSQDPSQVGNVSFPGRRFEEVSAYTSDRVFKDSAEYAGEWGAGEFTSEGEGSEAGEESPESEEKGEV
jgi:hypothetical protein